MRSEECSDSIRGIVHSSQCSKGYYSAEIDSLTKKNTAHTKVIKGYKGL